MPRSADQLLMPVNPLFVWTSLLIAFALNIVPLGRMPALPDFLALVLAFWNVHQSRRVGVGVAFFFGLLMDVHSGAVLGQHALAYTLLSFFAITVHRRLLWFAVPAQALQILPLFLAAHAVSLVVRVIAGGMFPAGRCCSRPSSKRCSGRS
jgi:rod shape-determining protein MreD